MPKSSGVSGLGLVVSLSGVLLVYSGVKDVGLVDTLRSIAGGAGLPAGAGPKVTTVSFTGAGAYESAAGAGEPQAADVPAFAGGAHPEVAEAAARYLGVPYVWGGKSPTGLDCSGLVYRAILDATGQKAPLSSTLQAVWGGFARIDRAQVGAGDVCWWPGHVVVATSNTDCISAPRPGKVVRREAIRSAGPVGTGEPARCLRLKAGRAGASSSPRGVAV